MFSPRSHGTYLLALIGWLGISIMITTCSLGSQDGSINPATNCNDIAILLPATGQESGRWEEKDYPKIERGIIEAIPEVTIRHFNANSKSTKQLEQAELALAQGSCILVVTPVDSTEASDVVNAAEKKGVPVIAYDRFIDNDNLSFYVTFDSKKVGEAQAEYAIAQIQQGDAGKYKLGNEVNLVMINGDRKDGNTQKIALGWLSTLTSEINRNNGANINFIFPRIDENKDNLESNETAKKLEFIGEDVEQSFMEGWSGAEAAKKVKELLNKNIHIILVANDGMANDIIASLGDRKGKILVTGQDGSAQSARLIVQGYQAMTLYKPIEETAKKTVDAIIALRNGDNLSILANGNEMTQNSVPIPSLLLDPTPVTIDNLEQTLIADGLLTLETLCTNLPPGQGGICP